MGRSKGKHLRRIAMELMKRIEFSEDLQKNKDLLRQMDLLKESKKELNKLVGEITTIVKQNRAAEREKLARSFSSPAPSYAPAQRIA